MDGFIIFSVAFFAVVFLGVALVVLHTVPAIVILAVRALRLAIAKAGNHD